MTRDATVVFPDQLFADHPGLQAGRPVFLVEEQLFFRDYHYPARFHKQKLILHRAALRAYQERLRTQGFTVHYLAYRADPQMAYLFDPLRQAGIEVVYWADPVDDILSRRLARWTRHWGLRACVLNTPKFLSPPDWLDAFFANQRRYNLTSFYIAQRQRLQILVDGGKPVGGKWSFDPENRKKIPRGLVIPRPAEVGANPYTREAVAYVARHFGDHPGNGEQGLYPVTHTDAEAWLGDFLTHRFALFGDYEDAMVGQETLLFHSLLTPMLNTGLLTPQQVIDAALAHAATYPVPLNALEGFIRQIIGWREFMRVIYLREGVNQRNRNFWAHHRPLPDSFYRGTTGIDPLDTVIRRVLAGAYCHHIERLMVVGNLMLLCEIHPDAVYQWFMEFFIDAYDWVMVPNVYGMSQYADGGLITTKPYLSGSNYIRKMSDFPAGRWCGIWDGLYWRFVAKHRDFFAAHPRLAVMAKLVTRLDRAKLQAHLDQAEAFLGSCGD